MASIPMRLTMSPDNTETPKIDTESPSMSSIDKPNITAPNPASR